MTVLREEIQKRTSIQLDVVTQWPATKQPGIALGLQADVAQFAGPFADKVAKSLKFEGFSLAVEHEPRVSFH